MFCVVVVTSLYLITLLFPRRILGEGIDLGDILRQTTLFANYHY